MNLKPLPLAFALAFGLFANTSFAQDDAAAKGMESEASADTSMNDTAPASDENAMVGEVGEEAEVVEEDKNWSVTGTLISDYAFRGVSQTQEEATLQLGWEYEWDIGFYIGLWGSGVDFTAEDVAFEDDPDESVEIDYIVGYRHSFSDNLAGDLQLVRYDYPGLADGFDFAYNELIGKLTLNDQYTFTLGYSNDLLNSGENGYYLGAAGAWEMPWEMSLNASLGYTFQDDLPGLDSYADWSLGLSRSFNMFDLALTYIDTDSNGHDLYGDLGDSRVVLSVSVGL